MSAVDITHLLGFLKAVAGQLHLPHHAASEPVDELGDALGDCSRAWRRLEGLAGLALSDFTRCSDLYVVRLKDHPAGASEGARGLYPSQALLHLGATLRALNVSLEVAGSLFHEMLRAEDDAAADAESGAASTLTEAQP